MNDEIQMTMRRFCASSFGIRHSDFIRVRGTRERVVVIRVYKAAFRTAIGCGAEIVAAVRAEAGAMSATRAEDRAKANRGEDGEKESGEPVWDPDIARDISCEKWAFDLVTEPGGFRD